MPPQRRPLFETDGNRRRRRETSPFTRGKIAAFHLVGLTQRQIMESTNTSRSVVRRTISIDIINNNRAALPRPGRPIIYSPRDKRLMLRSLRLEPKFTFDQRRASTGLDMSNSTIKSIAKENGLHHWRAKSRPALTPAVAALRLAWCKKREHWTIED